MHNNFLLEYRKQGLKNEAISLLETSLRWDALHRDAVCALAELYVSEGKDAEADAVHRDLLLATPHDPAAHNNYAAFLQRAGGTNKLPLSYVIKTPVYWLIIIYISTRHRNASCNVYRLCRYEGSIFAVHFF